MALLVGDAGLRSPKRPSNAQCRPATSRPAATWLARRDGTLDGPRGRSNVIVYLSTLNAPTAVTDDVGGLPLPPKLSLQGRFRLSRDAKYAGQPVAVQPTEPRSSDHALVLTAPARHYAVAAPVEPPLTLEDDRPLVLQYELTLREGLNCGGAYVKLLHATPELDAGLVTGETPYLVGIGRAGRRQSRLDPPHRGPGPLSRRTACLPRSS
jgi:hypothetical protein